MFRDLLTSLGGRTWLSATAFSVLAMTFATLLLWKVPDTFSGTNWVAALGVCAGLLGANAIKRAIENGRGS